jgi:short-subunit dehydrogenase
MTDFKTQYGDWALVAGASEGIGKSFATQLAEKGMNLILLSRRQTILKEVKREIQAQYDVKIVVLEVDLTSPNLHETVREIAASHDVGMLVYNAGAMHGASTLMDDDMERVLALIRLNCIGPVLMVKTLGRQMARKKRGGIILLSSMAALSGGAYIATYAATKAFDMILAESLWDELKGQNVHVLGLVAGATATPAMMNSGVVFSQDKEGQEKIVPMTPDQVAREGLENLGKKPVHIAGDNLEAATALRSAMDRAEVIEYMGKATASLYSKPYPVTD